MHGNKLYTIGYSTNVVKHDIPALSATAQKQIKKAIEERLAVDPLSFGKPLRYNLKGYRRLRVGDYRVIYLIKAETRMVLIVAIRHRKEAYDNNAFA